MSLFTHFQAYMLTEKCVSRNTFEAYRRDLEQFESFLIEQKIEMNAIRVPHVKLFLQHLKSVDLSARSMARKIAALRIFFSYAHERFGIKNCGQNLLTPKIEKSLPQFLTEQEVEQLLIAADLDLTPLGMRNKVILYLLYVSGMRITELVELRISAIHFDTGFLKVKGKREKERMIPIPESMRSLLRLYIETVHRDFMIRKGVAEHHDYLFPTTYGGKIKPITRQACWIILNALWAKTGIRKSISPHQLRHSLATHMLKNGVDLRSLQLILGHQNIATVEIYTHVEVTRAREEYDKKHPRS